MQKFVECFCALWVPYTLFLRILTINSIVADILKFMIFFEHFMKNIHVKWYISYFLTTFPTKIPYFGTIIGPPGIKFWILKIYTPFDHPSQNLSSLTSLKLLILICMHQVRLWVQSIKYLGGEYPYTTFQKFIIQNEKILEFCLNGLGGVLANRLLIC